MQSKRETEALKDRAYKIDGGGGGGGEKTGRQLILSGLLPEFRRCCRQHICQKLLEGPGRPATVNKELRCVCVRMVRVGRE